MKRNFHFPFSILHFPFSILHSPFSILHSPFSIFHSPFLFLLFSFFIFHFPFSILASPPLPSFRYYGMLSDEYGWPVTSDKNAELIIRVGTNECDRYTANEQLGYGINYILEVPIDNPSGTRYATYAARTGETVNISVYINGVLQPLMNTSSIPPVGESGNAVRLDLNMGEDTDHDGMSDIWETILIINNSEGRYTTVEEVLKYT